jgi:hypothetical protein
MAELTKSFGGGGHSERRRVHPEGSLEEVKATIINAIVADSAQGMNGCS